MSDNIVIEDEFIDELDQEDELDHNPITSDKLKHIKHLYYSNPDIFSELGYTLIQLNEMSDAELIEIEIGYNCMLFKNNNNMLLSQLFIIINRLIASLLKIDVEKLNENEELKQSLSSTPFLQKFLGYIPQPLMVLLRYGVAIIKIKFEKKNEIINIDDKNEPLIKIP